jgi:hypothetical protein
MNDIILVSDTVEQFPSLDERYANLVQGYASLVSAESPGALAKGAEFEVDGITFQFLHLSEAPEFVQICCTAFNIAPGLEDATYDRMLDSNLALNHHVAPILALRPETSEVCILRRLPIDSMTPSVLKQVVAALAENARQLKENLKG